MTPERRFWNLVAEKYRERGVHAVRVENVAGEGTPDVNWCAGVRLEGWQELKVVTSGFRVRFQDTQPGWIRRRWNAGGNVSLLIRDPQGCARLYSGEQIRELVAEGLDEDPLYRSLAGPSEHDWDMIVKVMKELRR